MMKGNVLLAVAVGFSLLVGPAWGVEVGIGDPAPMLEVSKWVKGEPVDLAEAKGKKIVVLEFWATWCRPCTTANPHLTKLQQQYADQGVVVVGVTSKDPDNTLSKVEEYVKRQGAKMGYTVAFDEPGKTDQAFMKAAGQSGIPTVFVIDRAGRIAWIGHPEDGLDKVLAQMVAGKYDIKLARRKFDLSGGMMEAALADDFAKVIHLADEYIALDRYALEPWGAKTAMYLVHLNQPDQALATARQAVEVFGDRPEELAGLARMLMPPTQEAGPGGGNPVLPVEADFKALALQAVTRAVKLASNNAEVRSAQCVVLASLERNDEAPTVAREVIALLKSDPGALSRFAMELSRPDPKNPCNDLALQAIDLAIAAEPEEPIHLQYKFQVLATCKEDHQAAERIGYYLVEKAAEDASLLNGFSWALLTDEPLAGKFNKLALAAAERCQQASSGNNWMFLDTLALAKFENGQVAQAVNLEKKALELCPDEGARVVLQESLYRFEGATD